MIEQSCREEVGRLNQKYCFSSRKEEGKGTLSLETEDKIKEDLDGI